MIVTISRAYGAGGLAVAEGLASALGYALLAEELTTTVAARMGTSPEAASQATAQPSLSERILGSLGAGTAELQAPDAPRPGDFDEALRSEIERTIRERAAQGNVVILGRGAGYMLAGTPGLFRAFLTGAREWRIGRVMDAFGKSREESIADLDRIDATRRKTAKERFKVHWGDASFYDMTLDVSTFDIDGSVAVLLAAIRAAEAVRTR